MVSSFVACISESALGEGLSKAPGSAYGSESDLEPQFLHQPMPLNWAQARFSPKRREALSAL